VSAPSEQDWTALLCLAGTGGNEYPWGWDDSYAAQFPGWEREEFEAAIARCREWLKEQGRL
jgi:hypothetical protein